MNSYCRVQPAGMSGIINLMPHREHAAERTHLSSVAHAAGGGAGHQGYFSGVPKSREFVNREIVTGAYRSRAPRTGFAAWC